jgi:hypothetical protein
MKRILLALGLLASLAACESVPPLPILESSPNPPAFHTRDFAWSSDRGNSAIRGEVDYGQGNGRYSCSGQPVILTPDAPYTRWRMNQLYGSVERAALPVSQVRSRQGARPSDDYSSFVRRTTCDAGGRFDFQGLPVGSWFIIVVVQPSGSGGEPVALMRRVVTRPGAVRSVLVG